MDSPDLTAPTSAEVRLTRAVGVISKPVMFLLPSGWGEVLEFVIQPAHLPIALAAGAMVFFTWRSLSASR